MAGKNIIHIGLPKTGSSFIQHNIFPNLSNIKIDYDFNNRRLRRLLRNSVVYNDADNDCKIKKQMDDSLHFLSIEALVGWNPRAWEQRADRNLELFGHNSIIVISLRETKDILRSIYLQMLHKGLIVYPENFFIRSQQYDMLSPSLIPSKLQCLDTDSFDYQRLKRIYEERFDIVYCVPWKKMIDLSFFSWILNLTNDQACFLKKNKKPKNVGFSKTAVKLTFLRESVFNVFGGTTAARGFQHPIQGAVVKRPCYILRHFPNWQSFMQNIVDRVVPYEKYQLPKSVCWNEELARTNDELIHCLDKDWDAIFSCNETLD